MKKKTMLVTLLLGGMILLTGCSKSNLANPNMNVVPVGGEPRGVTNEMTLPDVQGVIDDNELPPAPPSEN